MPVAAATPYPASQMALDPPLLIWQARASVAPPGMAPARELPVCRWRLPYPAYKWHWTHHYTGSVARASVAPPGMAPVRSYQASGGGYAFTRPTNGTGPHH